MASSLFFFYSHEEERRRWMDHGCLPTSLERELEVRRKGETIYGRLSREDLPREKTTALTSFSAVFNQLVHCHLIPKSKLPKQTFLPFPLLILLARLDAVAVGCRRHSWRVRWHRSPLTVSCLSVSPAASSLRGWHKRQNKLDGRKYRVVQKSSC